MFRRILVPLDGSKCAEQALPVAARLARASSGAIILLRVVASPIEFALEAMEAPMSMGEIFDKGQARAAHYLADIAASELLAGIPQTVHVFTGTPAEIILSVARSEQVDIIVICSHGYTGATRWVLGSVAEKVARHAPVPVFVLRQGGPIPADPHHDAARPLRALVALDGSTRAKAAIDPAARLITALATPTQGAMHLTQVVKPTQTDRKENSLGVDDTQHPLLDKAESYLMSTAEHLREGSVVSTVANLQLPITWSVALDTDVASALIRVAEHGEDAGGSDAFGGCDLIAIATHGYGGVQRWAMGSVTERVLHATRLPVLIVRPLDIMDASNIAWERLALSAI